MIRGSGVFLSRQISQQDVNSSPVLDAYSRFGTRDHRILQAKAYAEAETNTWRYCVSSSLCSSATRSAEAEPQMKQKPEVIMYNSLIH